MAETKQTPPIAIPAGFVMNAAGHLVPEHQVREHDKLRDQVARDLVTQALQIHDALARFKALALEDIADLIRISGDKYGVTLGGKKGNVSIFTYDGRYKIERAQADRIVFTDEILAAKELIDQCIRAWSKGANDHLRVLVDRAFRANRQGQIKTNDVLSLLRVEIDDPDWKRAMQALRDSIQVNGQAVYIRVFQRDGMTDRYLPISLNIAGV
ncbi:DUF3164 family protein [Pseudomonas knackmussii]|uniref:DUF3164 family protein n=1 Tax=Pseudomonas knackmussii TaxID=65741 RepID=UPI003F49C406